MNVEAWNFERSPSLSRILSTSGLLFGSKSVIDNIRLTASLPHFSLNILGNFGSVEFGNKRLNSYNKIIDLT